MVAPCWRSIASDFARLSSERQMPEEWQSSGEEFFPRTGRVKDGLAQCHVFECINNPLSLSELGLVLFPPPPSTLETITIHDATRSSHQAQHNQFPIVVGLDSRLVPP